MEDKQPLPFSAAMITLLLSLIFVYSFVSCMSKFIDIEFLLGFRLVFCLSILLSLVFDALIYSYINTIKKNRLGLWIEKNDSKLLLSYWFLIFIFISITNHIIWTTDEVHDVLSIEWTMFGLSITIFLVWNVLIVEYLRKKRPVAPEKNDYLSKYEYLLEKRAFSNEIDTTFLTVVLLSINLVLLLFSTGLVYISHKPEIVFTQNSLILTFYFSSNTISSLFFDILKPIKKDKNELKESSKVDEDEIDKALGGMIVETLIKTGIEAIQSSEELNEEQKKEGIRQYLIGIKEAFAELKKEGSQRKT